MKRAMALLPWCLLAVLVAAAEPAAAARHKPGPVTIRGVIAVLAHGRFTMRTVHQGTFTVETERATPIDEKGKRGAVTLRVGDHVGVRGFVAGDLLRAIHVRVYPTKPPERSFRGVVVSVDGNRLAIMVSGKRVDVLLTSSTSIVVSRGSGGRSALRPGSRVEVRVAGGTTLSAVHIRVFLPRAPVKRVTLRGTLAAVHGSSITVVSGKEHWTVGVTKATAVHEGSSRAGLGAMKTGQRVIVYACCAGHALQATSIHIRIAPVVHQLLTLHGRVVSLSAREIRLATAGGTTSIELASGTRYEIGTKTVARRDVWTGDQISVRAVDNGPRLVASRIHVLLSSRRARSVAGVVVVITKGAVTVRASGGRRYALEVGRGTGITLNGKRAVFSAIRRGDRVRTSARPGPGGTLVADRLTISRKPPKLVTVSGTLVWIHGTSLVIDEGHGVRRRVQLNAGVRAELHGRAAPSAALFVGVRVKARGQLRGTTLQAISLEVTVREGSVRGRITRVSAAALDVLTSTARAETVELAPGLLADDGRRHLAAGTLHPGAYVRARGYRRSASSLLAVSVAVEHPAIDSAGIVVTVQPVFVIRASRGQRFAVRLSAGTAVSVSRVGLPIDAHDIPVGAHVHVRGRVDTNGVLAVETMLVRLTSVSLRGKVLVDAGGAWSIQTAGRTYGIRLISTSEITQGTHLLIRSQVVSGDDITVDGYALAGQIVLGRKILVHRARVGIEGVVATVEPDGFVLQAVDGGHRVIAGPATVYTGTQVSLSAGLRVHVSGYLRGDGVILASSVRVEKSPKT
jgi:hypothetical protein